MIQAAIFDLDGLLIDSEPFWRRAEREVFAGLGVALTDADCASTMGLRVDEVVAHWGRLRPWQGASQEAVVEEVLERVEALVRGEGRAMEGVPEALEACRRRGWSLAVASSSPHRLIEAALETLKLREHFEATFSAEGQEYGKPHPGVFLEAARHLGVLPVHCLVLEDSLAGLVAAKAARMKAVAVPAPEDRSDPRWCLADLVLDSLIGLDDSALTTLAES